MTKHAWWIGALFIVVGCKKQDDGDKASSAKPVEAASCPAGATTDAALGYCIVLPAGWKEVKRDPMGSMTMVEYKDPANASSGGISIESQAYEDWRFKSAIEQEDGQIKTLVGKGDLLGGGRWATYKDASGETYATAHAHGAKQAVNCLARTTNPAELAICKTLVGL